MTKSVALILSFTASLLLWTTQVSGESFVAKDTSDSSEQYAAQSPGSGLAIGHSSGLFQSIRNRMSNFGFSMFGRSGESSRYGEAPAWEATAAPPVAQQSIPPTLAVPIQDNSGPAPSGFMGGVVTPSQYPPSASHPPQGYAPPPGYGSPSNPNTFQEQRIVYVPYAAPPPIYVERLGKALPRPPVVRRVLGDANIYEYPEMPLNTYTTRGPRDFLAPNPPSIGY